MWVSSYVVLLGGSISIVQAQSRITLTGSTSSGTLTATQTPTPTPTPTLTPSPNMSVTGSVYPSASPSFNTSSDDESEDDERSVMGNDGSMSGGREDSFTSSDDDSESESNDDDSDSDSSRSYYDVRSRACSRDQQRTIVWSTSRTQGIRSLLPASLNESLSGHVVREYRRLNGIVFSETLPASVVSGLWAVRGVNVVCDGIVGDGNAYADGGSDAEDVKVQRDAPWQLSRLATGHQPSFNLDTGSYRGDDSSELDSDSERDDAPAPDDTDSRSERSDYSDDGDASSDYADSSDDENWRHARPHGSTTARGGRSRRLRRVYQLRLRERRYQYRWSTSRAGEGVFVYILDRKIDRRSPEFLVEIGRGPLPRRLWDRTGISGYSDRTAGDNGGIRTRVVRVFAQTQSSYWPGEVEGQHMQGFIHHGTALAGLVGSGKYGVAKRVTLVSYDVYGGARRTRMSDLVEELDNVWDDVENRTGGSPTVAVFTITEQNPYYSDHNPGPVQEILESLVIAGMHVVVSAGNQPVDACRLSPARSRRLITVAGLDTFGKSLDLRSAYGDCVDLVAPSVGLLTTGWRQFHSPRQVSGTSFGTALVAGVIAQWIDNARERSQAVGSGSLAYSPERMKRWLVRNAWTDKVEMPRGRENTPNLVIRSRPAGALDPGATPAVDPSHRNPDFAESDSEASRPSNGTESD
ncbi:hypothetical protein PYCC9005_005492 [Savitreella phatthalungensis]